jgi:putative endonuclease
MPYFIYVLKSESTGSSYVGHTSNLEKRVVEHNDGKSLSTKGKRPGRLVYKEKYATRSEAASRERYFKSVKGRLELKAKGILWLFQSTTQKGERSHRQVVGRNRLAPSSIPISSTI